MNAKKLYDRVCATLEADVRRSWGRIQEVEEETCGRGMISRFYNGSREISLKPLLDFLCALEIHPASFFGRAFGRALDTEVLLSDMIVGRRSNDRLWRQVDSATMQLERDGDHEVGERTFATMEEITGMVQSMARATSREQMRRLRTTQRYRDRGFASAYLQHLNMLRDDQPNLVRRLTARVAIHLVPKIPGPLTARIELQCEALGIFSSAARLKAKFSMAAQALFVALQLAERHSLPDAQGRVLHRIAHLLEDATKPELALIPLREAIEIYVHSGSSVGLGKTLIVQGRIYSCTGRYKKAIEVLTEGLRRLPDERLELSQYYLAANQALAEAHRHLDNPQQARMLLAKAATFVSEGEHVRRARLTWQEGTFDLDEGDAAAAEALLHVSREDLEGHVSPAQEALVAVDLVWSQLRQKKFQEACDTASSAARFLEPLEGNPTAEAAVLELARAGIEGRLNLRIVHEVRRQLEEARPEARAR